MITVRTGLSSAGAVVSGVAASVCCLGPALMALGVGGLGFLSFLEPYRYGFIAVAVGLLGYGFYRTYRNADCCPPERLRVQKVVLLAATGLTVIAVLSPYLLPLFA